MTPDRNSKSLARNVFARFALYAAMVVVTMCLWVTRAHGQSHVASAASTAGAGQGGDGQSLGGLFDGGESPIGIDYAPENRCSDNNPTWLAGRHLVACGPQLSEPCGNSLNTCPTRCQKCYDDDLSFIRRQLKVKTITIYAPNYYILKAAQRLGMKVVVGLLNDSVFSLATPAGRKDCSYGALPFPFCGEEHAAALIDGACIDTAGGDPFKSCVSHCTLRSNPAADCVNGDCSCRSDAQCKGVSNRCLSGVYLPPLNNPRSGGFLRDGTVTGIQLGNEFFNMCETTQVPGQHQPCCSHDPKTGRCNAWTVTRDLISTAARTLRGALKSRGLNNVTIIVNLVQEQGPAFCRNGKPPPGVDYIAAHSYCGFVDHMPPQWTTLSGAECWKVAHNREFAIDRKACGVSRTYIGETGFNSGCPMSPKAGVLLRGEEDFIDAMVRAQPVCNGLPNPSPFPNFLFEYVDVCPPGGCLAGCGDPSRCSYNCCCKHVCSDTQRCAADCPRCVGNGYFGLYHAPGYGTDGFPPEAKFNPMPSLLCPASNK